jgi:hypothetical protein
MPFVGGVGNRIVVVSFSTGGFDETTVTAVRRGEGERARRGKRGSEGKI